MLLKVEGLHAHYGKSHILHGVDLAVEEASIVSLLGRNGSGRSTTLKTLMGIVPATQGNVKLWARAHGSAPFRNRASWTRLRPGGTACISQSDCRGEFADGTAAAARRHRGLDH